MASEKLPGGALGSVLAAGVGGVLGALLTALWESRGFASPGSAVPLLFGLGVGALTAVGLALGLVAWVLGAGAEKASWVERRANHVVCWLLLGIPLVPALLLLGAEATLGAFARELPSGPRAAASALVCVALWGVAAAVTSPVVDRLAPRVAPSLTPGRALVLAAGGMLLLLLVLVRLGDTGGGTGPWERFGVLGRDELDLRVPAYGVLAAALAAAFVRWLRRAPAWALAALVVLPQAALFYASSALDDLSLAIDVEQRTALGRASMRALQRATDRDGDGLSAAFGGGDCNDRDPDVHPGAVDVPGDGIDQDCSGADEVEAPPSPAPAPPVAATSTAESPRTVPGDLNVVLITVDTLRWDLGYTGRDRPVSPRLDAFAARSVIYEKAYALASYTGKSLGPMLIGRYGSETHRGWMHFNKYPRHDRMVQERLSEAGIHTLSIQGHWYFKEDTGLGRGFDVLDLSAAPEEPQGEGDRTVNSKELTDSAIERLGQVEGKRFFMWVHYLDPHSDYVAHEEFAFGSDPRALYDGEVAFTDHHIGRLLEAIEAKGLAGRTAIIFTSDHGEAFGEHGMTRHGFELWEAIVRVPLIVHVPGIAPGRVTQRRSLIDLAPTLLDLFGVSSEPGALRGKSWLADLADPSRAEARPVFLDMPPGPYNGERQAFIENDLKLTTSNTRTMGVYDLAKDPDETNNLMRDPAISKPLHERYLAFRRGLSPVKVTPR